MSDFHVLSQAEDQKTINVVFHFPVPAANNQAGVSYQVALVNYLGGADNIDSPVANATEIIAIKAGEVHEVSTVVRWSKLGLTPAQKLAEIAVAYNAKQAEMTGYFANVLEYFGHEGDV